MTQPHTQPALTRAQVREVDRLAIEKYGIPGIVLMENASRNAADFVLDMNRQLGPIAIVCGRGNNGGDGFAMARHLCNAGESVTLFLACDPKGLQGDALTNATIATNMEIPQRAFNSPDAIEAALPALHAAAIIIDAVLGTGFSGNARPPLDRVIEAINTAERAAIVAVDVPSGLDCDTGEPSNATVRANHTVTFVANKLGFLSRSAEDYTGNIHVADIGSPPELIQEVLSGSGSG